jgi:ribose transport system ATP-binding protein
MVTEAQHRTALLAMTGVRKEFTGTQALVGIDLEIRTGEIHALLGENGAGKSTLVKIMGGVLLPDGGAIQVDGGEVSLNSPAAALREGITVVHQELSLMSNLTVGENLCMYAPPVSAKGPWKSLGLLDRRRIREETWRAGEMLSTTFNPNELVGTLNPARRQLVEIGRALLGSTRLLLLDEPTSSLPPHERQELFARLRELRRQGIAIVFVTHALEEALALSDCVTVLRDGRKVGTRRSADTAVEDLIEMMTGRQAGSVFPAAGGERKARTPRLRVQSLACPPLVSEVSFEVFPGEILGLAGLVGSGRTETLKTLFGALKRAAGTVELDGEPVEFGSPRAAIGARVAYIPQDRQAEGLFPDHSVLMNLGIAAVNSPDDEAGLRRGPFVNGGQLGRLGRDLVSRLRIKTPSVSTPIASLSGGNQQKAILARWLAVRPGVVLADEPTRGVSIGSKVEIYRLLRELSDRGAAIVVVSSEFDELVGLCNRVVLMKGGRSVGEVPTEGIDPDALLNLVLST